MDRALITLMKLQTRAAVRRALRGVRTPRGAVFFAVGLLVFGMWLGPVAFATFFGWRHAPLGVPSNPARARELAPALLLLVCVASLFSTGDRAISFTPGEVNFLFAGPFTRRQLLGYKLAKATLGALATALMLSFVLRRHAHSWLAAFVGTFLAMLLMQLFATCAVLLGQTVSKRAYNFGRRAVVVVVIVAAAAALRRGLTGGSDGGAAGGGSAPDLASMLHRFGVSPGGRVVLAPFTPFARAFAAESLVPDLLAWAAAAALVNVALVVLMMRLDADYLEAAAAASERVYERARRIQRGDWTPSFGRPGAGGGTGVGARGWRAWRLRVPQLPWLGGTGPVAWRQLAAAGRKSGGLLYVLLLCAGLFVMFFFVGRKGTDLTGAVVSSSAWFTILMVANLKFDFRGDLDQMGWLKSLPLRPSAVAAGQLVTPVALLTVCHLGIFAAGAVVAPSVRLVMAVMAVLALPFNVVLLAVENLTFLLYPARGAAMPGELSAVGRQVVMFVVKLAAVALACGLAAAVGAAALALSRSPGAALAAAFVTLAAEGAALVPAVAWAYRRFDPSLDTPP